MMLPKGLEFPHPDAFHTSPGTPTRPPDYPARLPFVPNEPCEYGESASVALCLWERGVPSPQERDALRAPIDASVHDLQAGNPIDIQRARSAWDGVTTTPQPAVERLHRLLQVFGKIAHAEGWREVDAQDPAVPPGSRYRRYERDAEVIVAMAVPTPLVQGLTVCCFDHRGT